MPALAKFLPYVLPHVQGCTLPFAEMAIRQSADEFCRKSRVLRETPDAIEVLPGQTEYEISPDTGGTVIYDVADVEISGQTLEAFEKNSAYMKWRTFFTLKKTGRETLLLLKTVPMQRGWMSLTLILVPEAGISTLPDPLFDDWREVLAAGALARLCATPNQPFTQLDLAQYQRGLFQDGVHAALVKATLGGGFKATLRVRPSP
jgi:hypothetical protein